jgi:hypothetical protein
MVRGMEALGASAYATASYVFVVDIFPENIGSVLVSIFVISVQTHLYLCHSQVPEGLVQVKFCACQNWVYGHLCMLYK